MPKHKARLRTDCQDFNDPDEVDDILHIEFDQSLMDDTYPGSVPEVPDMADIEYCAKLINAKPVLDYPGKYDRVYLEALRLTDPCGGRFCSECEIGGCEGPVNFA